MRCAVFGCANNNKGKKKSAAKISYFRFPTNKKLLQKWILYCNRRDKFNVKTSRICCAHFCNEDYDSDIKYQMGYRKNRILKRGVCPTKDFDPPKNTAEDTKIKRRIKERNIDPSLQSAVDAVPNEKSQQDQLVEATEQIKSMQEEIDNLNRKKLILHSNESLLLRKLKLMENMLMKDRFENINMKSKLRTIFTEAQVKRISRGVYKRQNWTEEDIACSISLYTTSAKAYNLLRRKKFPLPAISTLQAWAQKLNVSIDGV